MALQVTPIISPAKSKQPEAKTEGTKIGQKAEKTVQPLRKLVGQFLRRVNLGVPRELIILLGGYPENAGSRQRLCTDVRDSIVHTPKCPSAHEWINEQWYVHAVEFYSAVKRDETLTCAGTWMNLEDLVLSERSQTVSASGSGLGGVSAGGKCESKQRGGCRGWRWRGGERRVGFLSGR